jgi:hypothetical protein
LLLTCPPPQVCFLPFPQLLFCLVAFSIVPQFFFLPSPQLSLEHYVLVIKSDMDVFTKVLEPQLVIVPIPKVTRLIVNTDNEYSIVERQPKRILDCEINMPLAIFCCYFLLFHFSSLMSLSSPCFGMHRCLQNATFLGFQL